MIDSAAAPVGIHLTNEAIRQSVQHDRNSAPVESQDENAKTDFEGNGPSDPVRGVIIDINV